MNKKNIVRFLFLTIFLLFLCLYIGQAQGYYEITSYQKKVLTEDAIERFEKDVKEGKLVEAKNYLEEEKVYSNSLNKMGMTASNTIEKIFNKTMSYIFKEVNKAVNSK